VWLIPAKIKAQATRLLEANHIRLSFGQPSQEVVEPLIDVVNVEGGDFHQAPFRGSSSLPRGF